MPQSPCPRSPAAALVLLAAAAVAGCGSGGSTAGSHGANAITAGVVPVGRTVSAPENTPTAATATSKSVATPKLTPAAPARARKPEPIHLQVAAPRQGQSVGADVLVYGASEPPADVTANGILATREGIGFRVSLHLNRPGRQLIHVTASLPGFVRSDGWLAVCVGAGAGPQSVPQGLGALRHAAAVQLARRQALRVRCSG